MGKPLKKGKTRPVFCFVFSRFLYLPMEVSIKVANDLVMNRNEDKRFLCLDAFQCQQFLPICEWRCKDIDTWITGIILID